MVISLATNNIPENEQPQKQTDYVFVCRNVIGQLIDLCLLYPVAVQPGRQVSAIGGTELLSAPVSEMLPKVEDKSSGSVIETDKVAATYRSQSTITEANKTQLPSDNSEHMSNLYTQFER